MPAPKEFQHTTYKLNFFFHFLNNLFTCILNNNINELVWPYHKDLVMPNWNTKIIVNNYSNSWDTNECSPNYKSRILEETSFKPNWIKLKLVIWVILTLDLLIQSLICLSTFRLLPSPTLSGPFYFWILSTPTPMPIDSNSTKPQLAKLGHILYFIVS